ncbi:lipid A export permease/ATP-binding protein MsbA [Herbaspirillum huttiense]|uniref:lipid A export permease/ATP-binding protein MsbA n=1 Tax=Herbaspirillum huttiense TaxID=863372 RepID=UPI0010650DBA|nr:lipid A export permease/ATP-binding protein MsbA [Herbaspirillum huttiense]QBP76806.1 lipid A export permease/ATP-binding protein MsbA [Herbaspirillum huttiense]
MKVSPYIKRLIEYHRPYQNRLILAFLGMLVTATTEPVVAYIFKILLDHGFVENPTFPLWLVPVAVIGAFVARGASTFLTTYMMSWVSTRVLNELRQTMFDRILHVGIDFTSVKSTGSTINSIMFEVQQIIDMVTKIFISMIRCTLTIAGLLAYMLYISWSLTIIALVLMPLMTFLVRLTGKRLKRLNKDSLTVNAELTQVIEETTRAQQVVKIFGGQAYERHRFHERAEKLRRYSMRMVSVFAATVPLTQIMTACAMSVMIMLALIQASHNQITVGGFISFFTAMIALLAPLKQLAEVNGPLQRGMAAAEAVFALIDSPVERTTGRELSARAEGNLRFEKVGFRYREQERAALTDIDLDIAAGQTVAFVGMSGGGKTTLVNLIPGFYSVSSGRILLDGVCLEDISLPSLRRQIAMVSQHVVLFDDTVVANIAYGDASPDLERVQAAIKAAYLDDVVAGLPQGVDTPLGDNGNRLSGGQRQRMAIARAIYKNAPILILDEATSALDTESERAVQAALDQLMKNRTTLVIAHRLSTIERADRIVVLSEGRIVEVGSHQALLERQGAYANLYRMQFAGEGK